ncbi:hypothetical protein SAMN04515647_3155 [Cohaesibacter sp. ES.047]|uniref:hypothetical protein n=1 Tax=Cohaesibacter sp. ES.047 TaxID=1798205 RepID=UPI000BC04A75|nr:hypothetical protein [Cohaesibacter sp. ES.047]SNY92890.1 hypothetical protein SAMN04515647_3155 [Cohaesibacter sp. ES.047]
MGFLNEKFPNALILPLIITSQPFYNLSVPNYVYDAELDFFRQYGIYYHDIRRELYSMFGETPPGFLYSDAAHFHRGFVCALIGRTLAEKAFFLLALKRNGIEQVPSKKLTNFASYIDAKGLVAAGRGCQVETISVRRFSVDYLEIDHSNSLEVELDGFPICIYLASDLLSSNLRLSINGNEYAIATKHRDCQEGKFMFTSVPIVLNESIMQVPLRKKCLLKFSLEQSSRCWEFDCFQSNVPSSGQERVRIAGIATVPSSFRTRI